MVSLDQKRTMSLHGDRPLLLLLVSFISHYLEVATDHTPVDQHATLETRQVLSILHTISRDQHKVLFGQHLPTQSGVYGGHSPYSVTSYHGGQHAWKYTHEMAVTHHTDELCDVCSLVNDFPAVVGMDLSVIDNQHTATLTQLTRLAWERGAIITASWHHDNPVTGGSFYIKNDQGPVHHSIRKILPGGDNYHNLLADLDAVAAWTNSLKDSRGRSIPVIFRPWHEADGGWFWWGLGNDAHNSHSDVKRLYQVTVEYLRDTKGVHNFLYAFSPGCGYEWNSDVINPGDAYVDVIGLDCYQSATRTKEDFVQAVEGAVTRARATGKVAAVTEFGLTTDLANRPSFFTHDVLQPMVHGNQAMGVAYMTTWANRCGSDTCSVFVPYPGHQAADDFRAFYDDSHTMFLSNLRRYAAWFYR